MFEEDCLGLHAANHQPPNLLSLVTSAAVRDPDATRAVFRNGIAISTEIACPNPDGAREFLIVPVVSVFLEFAASIHRPSQTYRTGTGRWVL